MCELGHEQGHTRSIRLEDGPSVHMMLICVKVVFVLICRHFFLRAIFGRLPRNDCYQISV